MSSVGTLLNRTTPLLFSQQLLSSLRRTQEQLIDSQNQISSGKEVEKPSDSPAKASAILLLQSRLNARDQHDRNLEHVLGVLNNSDAALGDVNELLLEASSIASSQVGVGSSRETRQNQAAVIDSMIKSFTDIANRQYQGVYLFGGSGAANGGLPFQPFLGGIRYAGTTTTLAADVGLDEAMQFTYNGDTAFAALSARVKGIVDLDPQATAATKLSDLNGAQAVGIRKATIVVTIDSTAVNVDLTDADTLGDVVSRVNAAINSVDNTAGSLSVSGSGLSLTAAGGHTIQIADPGAGQTAADLGIVATATGATVAGGNLDAKLTAFTTLASLGITADLTSGILVTQGSTSKALSFSGATTIQDLMNRAQQLDLGVRLEINSTGKGLNFVSDVSGLNLSIGENGGTTAQDLGVRTFSATTSLSDFNHGLGVSNVQGSADFSIQLHDGRTFNVDMDGATTVADVISKITAAAQAAGLTVGAPGQSGTDFNIGLKPTGNGFSLEDGTSGGSDFKVTQLGASMSAYDLGIYTNAAASSSIGGADNATVRVESVLSHLIALRDALQNDDNRGITLAGDALQQDSSTIATVRADVGVKTQQVDQQQKRSADLKIAEQSLLSNLQDADLTSVITMFTRLQQQLQASLQVGALNGQQSLLDYLR